MQFNFKIIGFILSIICTIFSIINGNLSATLGWLCVAMLNMEVFIERIPKIDENNSDNIGESL